MNRRAASWTNWTKYGAITRISLQNSLAYVGEFAARSIFMVLILFVFVQLWRTTYGALGTQRIAGLSFPETIWYLVLTETLMTGAVRIYQRVSDEVKDGSIAYTLGRPYDYLLYHFSTGLGESLLRMGINFTAGAALVWLMVGPPPCTWPALPGVLLALLLALLLEFCFGAIIGLLAFFTEDVGSFYIIYQKLIFIVGGMLIPLEFLPDWLRDVALKLPFSYAMYAPARLFVRWDVARFIEIVAMQVLWIAIVGLALLLIYRYGTRRLSINGG